MASVPGLYGVDVARHDPQLDHVTGFDVVGVYSCDTEKVCGFVDNVHFVDLVYFEGVVWRINGKRRGVCLHRPIRLYALMRRRDA